MPEKLALGPAPGAGSPEVNVVILWRSTFGSGNACMYMYCNSETMVTFCSFSFCAHPGYDDCRSQGVKRKNV